MPFSNFSESDVSKHLVQLQPKSIREIFFIEYALRNGLSKKERQALLCGLTRGLSPLFLQVNASATAGLRKYWTLTIALYWWAANLPKELESYVYFKKQLGTLSLRGYAAVHDTNVCLHSDPLVMRENRMTPFLL
jgi:hypothetical protein